MVSVDGGGARWPSSENLLRLWPSTLSAIPRLMGEDEAGKAHAKAVQRASSRAVPSFRVSTKVIVEDHGRRSLAGVSSIVAAVECAVAIQNMMVERNVGAPEARRVVYRIGMHLGECWSTATISRSRVENRGAAREHLRARGRGNIPRRLRSDQRKACFGLPKPQSQKRKNIARAVEEFDKRL